MAKKDIKRPYTLAVGILLILLGAADFLDTFKFDSFSEIQILMMVIGLVLVLFAFAKSD